MRNIILLFAVFFSLALSAQEKELTGFVCNDENTPITNATVIVSQNDSVIGIGESNDEGRFSVSELPNNAKVGIYIHHLNYQALNDSVDLGSSDFYLAKMHETSMPTCLSTSRSPISVSWRIRFASAGISVALPSIFL